MLSDRLFLGKIGVVYVIRPLALLVMLWGTVVASASFAGEPLKVVGVAGKDYTRLLFYCKQPVTFTPELDERTLRVSFDREFTPDFAEIIDLLGVRIASASKDGQTLKFGLQENGSYRFRRFLGEDFVGLDLIETKAVSEAPKATKKAVKTSSNADTKPLALAKQAPVPTLRKEYELLAVTTEQLPPALPANATEPSETPDEIKNFELAQAMPEQTLPQKDEPLLNDKDEADVITPDDEEQTQDTPPLQEEELTETEAPEETVITTPVVNVPRRDTSHKTMSEQERDLALSELRALNTEGKITFPWTEEVGSAVFTRGDYLWVVFDKNTRVAVQDIVAAHKAYFTQGEQVTNKHYTILRFRLTTPTTHFVAYKEDSSWVVGITEEETTPIESPEVNVSMSELHGSTVEIPSPGETKPIRLIDPEIGDELIVIPFAHEGNGMAIHWKYTDFVILPTTQGVAVQLISDDIELQVADNKVGLIGPANRLAGSAQSALRELQEREREAKLRAERLKQKATELALIRFKTWSLGNQRSFRKNLRELQLKITEANWGEKSEPRLELARFYFAHGLAAEAYGVSEMIRIYDEDFANTNDAKILEGAALYMMERYADATNVFDSMDMNQYKEERDVEEARFWQAAAHIQLDHEVKMDKFMSQNPIEEQKKDKSQILDSGDKVEITRLMFDTSSRLLKMIRKMDPDFVNAREVQTLESTARFVVDHYQDAVRRFEETDLFRSGDVFEAEEDKLWWSTSSSRRGTKVDFPFIDKKGRFLKYYPDALYNDFALLALEDRIQKNDLGAAEEILQSFREDDKRKHFKNSAKFLEGLFYAKDEEPEKAIETWEVLTKDVFDRYNRTRATFALTVFKLQRKEMNIDEAIANFNSIRSAWRGGVLELNTLKLLGEFYMDKKDYMEGFKVWREVVASFPGSEEALLTAKRMSEKFVQIFNQGEDDEIDQLQALTLYYEFRELTPIGKLGDEMIGRLADRLIKIDLLDRAAALLTHQVRFRLSGEEKDRASVKLVKVHLANQNPQAALDVLNATGINASLPELEEEKKYLKAQTLIELGKNNQVLSLLKGDINHQASFLRADVYWREKVWKKVIEELETPFRELRRAERSLSEDEMQQLLRLAVAYAIVERKKRLQILYEDFVNFVNNQEMKKILTFVASDRGTVDFRDLEYSVGYDDMQAFLNEYLKSQSQTVDTPAPTPPAGAI